MTGTSQQPSESNGIEEENVWDDSSSFAVQEDCLPDGRSFQAEMWGEAGYTFLTYRFPVQGLEQYSKSQVVDYLETQGVPIDPEKFPVDNIQLLPNHKNSDLLELTLTIGESDD
ncbi:hypothetical protein NQU17_00190 [Clostridiaceae bacterium HFYG-1003]|nr:hypothetical protein NQU17_00190 [Clostridiaceae bacterium HFYG-1003]